MIEDFIGKQTKVYNKLIENVNKLNIKVELLATQKRLLDNQVVQQATSFSCQHGQLPEKPKQNLKEQVQAITLRSRRGYERLDMSQEKEQDCRRKELNRNNNSKGLSAQTLQVAKEGT